MVVSYKFETERYQRNCNVPIALVFLSNFEKILPLKPFFFNV